MGRRLGRWTGKDPCEVEMTDTMPSLSVFAGGELYTEVLQFHSRQLTLIDEGLYNETKLAEWSRTLAEDAEHWVNSMPAPVHGRQRILAAQMVNPVAVDLVERGMLRRHLITNLVVEPQPDGVIHSTYYVQIVDTPRGGPVEIGTCTTVRETLVRKGGRLFTQRREVYRDDLR
jgi:hypothetical protein